MLNNKKKAFSVDFLANKKIALMRLIRKSAIIHK